MIRNTFKKSIQWPISYRLSPLRHCSLCKVIVPPSNPAITANQSWISAPVRSFSEHFASVADTDKRTQCKKWFEIVQYGTAEELHEAIEDGGVDVNCRNEVSSKTPRV
jgi:hypothetical protein